MVMTSRTGSGLTEECLSHHRNLIVGKIDGKLSWVPLVDRDLANRQKGSGDQLAGSLQVILCGQ